MRLVPVVRPSAVPRAIRDMRLERHKDWQPHTSLKRFLADWFPDDWEEICRCGFDVMKHAKCARHCGWDGDPSDWCEECRVKLTFHSCHKIPLCIVCSDLSRRRRVLAALDKFAKCTPAGKQPVFWHIVQQTPRHKDGSGWGDLIAGQQKKLRRVVWNVLKDAYGEGIGAILSYHDFAEKGPGHVSPHIDLTLNGWKLADGKPVLVQEFDFRRGGYDRWQQLVSARAQVVKIGATGGNVNIRRTEGYGQGYQVLKYQMRELLDLKKIEYERNRRCVWWTSYRDGGKRTRYSISGFIDAMDAYQRRAGPKREGLHAAHGHMAKRSLGATQRLMGGEKRAHKYGCSCSLCGDWQRIYMPWADREAGIPVGVSVR